MAHHTSFSPDDLVRACAGSKDPDVWEEFIRRFQPVIAAAVLRTARRWGEPSRQTVDDLVQDTYLKLCDDDSRLLRSFQPRHPDSIFGFLKVVAANVVHDHFKSALAEKRGASQTDTLSDQSRQASLSTHGGSFGEMERRILLQQVDQALTQVAGGEEQERNRLIFWLYYRDGMSASAIASLPYVGLSTKGVESIILRMTRVIRSHMLEPSASTRPGNEGVRRAKSL